MKELSNAPTHFEYDQLYDDEEFEVADLKSFKLQCCDCALVHDVSFRIEGDRLFMTICQNKKETKRVRKESK